MALLQLGTQISAAQSGKRSEAITPRSGSAYALIPRKSRATAPDFHLSDIRGKLLTLAQYRGKVVLLDFWAVDCGGCRVEIPWYVAFDNKYHKDGLAVIGVDMYGETPDYIRPFMQKEHMTYRIAIGNDAIGKQFHAEELPMTLLIDRTGKIAVVHVGIVDKAKFETDIQQLLK